MSRLVPIGLALAALLAVIAVSYGAGKRAERSVCAAAEAARVAAIAERMAEQLERSAALDREVERLRSRPERVRTITKEIRLAPDAECASAPPDLRWLWNAGADPGPAAGAAAVGNAGVP